MKLRNYLMFWLNRLVDPNFKNEYYQANLKQFWTHTYENLCLALFFSLAISLFLFPWGLGWSKTHPLKDYGFLMAFKVIGLSMTINLTIAFVLNYFCRNLNPPEDKYANVGWVIFSAFLLGFLIQNLFTDFLYESIPIPLLASVTPLLFVWSVISIINFLPEKVLNYLHNGINKVIDCLHFIVMDPISDKSRLEVFLSKHLGAKPKEENYKFKELEEPIPKDYKIWGAKSKQEKELQKILDE